MAADPASNDMRTFYLRMLSHYTETSFKELKLRVENEAARGEVPMQSMVGQYENRSIFYARMAGQYEAIVEALMHDVEFLKRHVS